MPAPIPVNEAERLAAVADAAIVGTEAEPWFDVFTEAAAALFEAPMSAISFITHNEQWFKAAVGIGIPGCDREDSFCAHAMAGTERLLVIEDALLDPRFATNILVTGAPFIRFYAGATIRSPEGLPLGALLIIDRTPRRFDAGQRAALEGLANGVESVLEQRRHGAYLAG